METASAEGGWWSRCRLPRALLGRLDLGAGLEPDGGEARVPMCRHRPASVTDGVGSHRAAVPGREVARRDGGRHARVGRARTDVAAAFAAEAARRTGDGGVSVQRPAEGVERERPDAALDVGRFRAWVDMPNSEWVTAIDPEHNTGRRSPMPTSPRSVDARSSSVFAPVTPKIIQRLSPVRGASCRTAIFAARGASAGPMPESCSKRGVSMSPATSATLSARASSGAPPRRKRSRPGRAPFAEVVPDLRTSGYAWFALRRGRARWRARGGAAAPSSRRRWRWRRCGGS